MSEMKRVVAEYMACEGALEALRLARLNGPDLSWPAHDRDEWLNDLDAKEALAVEDVWKAALACEDVLGIHTPAAVRVARATHFAYVSPESYVIRLAQNGRDWSGARQGQYMARESRVVRGMTAGHPRLWNVKYVWPLDQAHVMSRAAATYWSKFLDSFGNIRHDVLLLADLKGASVGIQVNVKDDGEVERAGDLARRLRAAEARAAGLRAGLERVVKRCAEGGQQALAEAQCALDWDVEGREGS